MNVLLIEDNQYKASQLEKFINEEFPFIILTTKGSYNSGLREIILNNIYELILLDISMPTYDVRPGESGGEPIPLAGKFILKEMFLRDITTNVIVVTMYENFVDGTQLKILNEQFKQEFDLIYRGYVYFAHGDSSWKETLKKLIQVIL